MYVLASKARRTSLCSS